MATPLSDIPVRLLSLPHPSQAATPPCTAWTAPPRPRARPAPSTTSTSARRASWAPTAPTDWMDWMDWRVWRVPEVGRARYCWGTLPCGAAARLRRSARRPCRPTPTSSCPASRSSEPASTPPSPWPRALPCPPSPSTNLPFPRFGRFTDSATANPSGRFSAKRAAFLAPCRDDPSSCPAQSLRRPVGAPQPARIREAPTACLSKTLRGRRPLPPCRERFSIFILVSWTVIACQLWNLRWQSGWTPQVGICEVECEARLYSIEISLSAGSSASSTPSQQNTLRLLRWGVRASYDLVCWTTRG